MTEKATISIRPTNTKVIKDFFPKSFIQYFRAFLSYRLHLHDFKNTGGLSITSAIFLFN